MILGFTRPVAFGQAVIGESANFWRFASQGSPAQPSATGFRHEFYFFVGPNKPLVRFGFTPIGTSSGPSPPSGNSEWLIRARRRGRR